MDTNEQNHIPNLTVQEYMDFLQKSRWKIMGQKKKGENLSETTSWSWKRVGGGWGIITPMMMNTFVQT